MRDLWIVILALAALLAGYLAKDLGLLEDTVADLIVQSDCPLRERACEVSVPGFGRVVLAIAPNDFLALSQLSIELDTAGFTQSVSTAAIQFEGLNMDMGYNRVVLEPVPETAGKFAALGMLPSCTAEKMFWRFHLFLTVDGQRVDVQFPVEI